VEGPEFTFRVCNTHHPQKKKERKKEGRKEGRIKKKKNICKCHNVPPPQHNNKKKISGSSVTP
jgi:hypothetical protein